MGVCVFHKRKQRQTDFWNIFSRKWHFRQLVSGKGKEIKIRQWMGMCKQHKASQRQLALPVWHSGVPVKPSLLGSPNSETSEGPARAPSENFHWKRNGTGLARDVGAGR